jgi:hypothetical protein
MPVEFIHVVIGALFLTVWIVISQFAFGHDAPREPKARVNK